VFGRPPGNSDAGGPLRTPAADVARIQGGGLVQVIVSSTAPMTYAIYLNGHAIPQIDVESLSVTIEAPNEGAVSGATARAILSRYVKTVSGERSLQTSELFPCTLDFVAVDRRITVTCLAVDSLDRLWINLGLKPDGSSAEVSGAKSLQILLTEELLSAKLTWVDGESEDLLPQPILQ
jgi:hypothetical protein